MTLDKALLGYLKGIRDNGPFEFMGGICHNVSIMRRKLEYSEFLIAGEGKPHSSFDLTTRLAELWVDWPHYSGNEKYPVPVPEGHGGWLHTSAHQHVSNEEQIFNRTTHMWFDAYGELRLDLLHYLIERLEAAEVAAAKALDIMLCRGLKKMRDDGPHDAWKGICGNLSHADIELYHRTHVVCPPDYEFEHALLMRMRELFAVWPKFTGDPVYPVPYPHGAPAAGYDSHTHDLWSGKYGKSRMALLDFMIKELERE